MWTIKQLLNKQYLVNSQSAKEVSLSSWESYTGNSLVSKFYKNNCILDVEVYAEWKENTKNEEIEFETHTN